MLTTCIVLNVLDKLILKDSYYKFSEKISIIDFTYLTDKEKSPGLDSLIRMRKPPSGLLANSLSASALVILP